MAVHDNVRISFWEWKTCVSLTQIECAPLGSHLDLDRQLLGFGNPD